MTEPSAGQVSHEHHTAAEAHWGGVQVAAGGGSWSLSDGMPLLLCCLAVVAATALLALMPDASRPKKADGGESGRAGEGLLPTLLSPALGLRRKLQHFSSGLLILLLYLGAGLSPSQASLCLLGSAAALFAVHSLRPRVPAVQRAYLSLFGSLMRPHEREGAAPGALFLLLGCGLATELYHPLSVTRRAILGVISDKSMECGAPATAPGLPDLPALCMLCLALGDPLASLVGQTLGGRDRHRTRTGKSVWAAAAMMAACTLASYAMLAYTAVGAGSGAGESAVASAFPAACPSPAPSWSHLSCADQLASASRARWAWSAAAAFWSSLFELWSPTLLGLRLRDDNLRMPIMGGAAMAAMQAAGFLSSTLAVAPHCASDM